jgi:uncharacterized protein (DUF2147 family)
MKALFTMLTIFFVSMAVSAQSFEGVYETIDDETNEAKSHIKIYEKDGMYYGRVIELLPAATTEVCIDCPGDKNGARLTDIDIVWDMKPYKDYWSYGHIVDPASGKVYKCNIWLEGNDLKVRGYIGISVLGRTQTWHRVE